MYLLVGDWLCIGLKHLGVCVRDERDVCVCVCEGWEGCVCACEGHLSPHVLQNQDFIGGNVCFHFWSLDYKDKKKAVTRGLSDETDWPIDLVCRLYIDCLIHSHKHVNKHANKHVNKRVQTCQQTCQQMYTNMSTNMSTNVNKNVNKHINKRVQTCHYSRTSRQDVCHKIYTYSPFVRECRQ